MPWEQSVLIKVERGSEQNSESIEQQLKIFL